MKFLILFSLLVLCGANARKIRHERHYVADYLSPKLQFLRLPASQSPSEGRIIGGVEAAPGEFPFLVSLQQTTYFGQKYHHCGGTIYDEKTIITAAHCVVGGNVEDMRIIAGDHDLFVVEGHEQVRNVASYVHHASYDGTKFDNDTAIVFLDHPLQFNERVAPLKLATAGVEPSGECVTAGWGNTRTGGSVSLPAKPQKTALAIVDRETCDRRYATFNDITDGMVCAGDRGIDGTCNGDSGGPLICKSSDDQLYLAGITSWGISPCGNADQYPSAYANVAHYIGWFTENAKA